VITHVTLPMLLAYIPWRSAAIVLQSHQQVMSTASAHAGFVHADCVRAQAEPLGNWLNLTLVAVLPVHPLWPQPQAHPERSPNSAPVPAWTTEDVGHGVEAGLEGKGRWVTGAARLACQTPPVAKWCLTACSLALRLRCCARWRGRCVVVGWGRRLGYVGGQWLQFVRPPPEVGAGARADGG
jgi:hypothetical protein